LRAQRGNPEPGPTSALDCRAALAMTGKLAAMEGVAIPMWLRRAGFISRHPECSLNQGDIHQNLRSST
jgi:hypothetical protein